MRVVSVRPVPPEPSRCIEVDSPRRLFASAGADGLSVVSHNSVVQRNIILGAILRPDHWRFLGIDLKKVELSSYRAYKEAVLGIATEIEDALTVLRFAHQTMMKRYAEMEEMGIENFLLLPQRGQALMVMVDEAGELLGANGIKTEEGKHEDELKAEAAYLIGSICRLGRAAGVHIVIATQRPDAKLISGETKSNLGARINCGRTDSTASSMILGSADGTQVKSNPRGRGYVRIFNEGNHAQFFFAPKSWMDEYLESKGRNPDGTRANKPQEPPAGQTQQTQGLQDDAPTEEDAYSMWGFEEDDGSTDGTPGMEGPVLNGASKPPSTRPEDDWDSELEDLIELNNS